MVSSGLQKLHRHKKLNPQSKRKDNNRCSTEVEFYKKEKLFQVYRKADTLQMHYSVYYGYYYVQFYGKRSDIISVAGAGTRFRW